MVDKKDKIYIPGHQGLLGKALVERLKSLGYDNLLLRSRNDLDLRCQKKVEDFFCAEKPDCVIMAAAKVGGIQANISYPVEFIYDNLMIQNNIINFSYRFGVKKLLFLASACSYPRQCPQPIKEEYLLSGCLEPTNEFYAVAKIAGIKLIQAYCQQYGKEFICAVPTNMYGPGDNFDLYDSHVIPALIRKFYHARENREETVSIWGSGEPRREFIFVKDVADACIFLMNVYSGKEIVNVGVGYDVSIKELCFIIKDVVGYEGKVVFDRSKPDGMPRKMLDISKMTELGWRADIELERGIHLTYQWYKDHVYA